MTDVSRTAEHEVRETGRKAAQLLLRGGQKLRFLIGINRNLIDELLRLSRLNYERIKVTPFGINTYFMFAPNAIRSVLANREEFFQKNPRFVEVMTPLLGKALFIDEGSRWRTRRKRLARAYGQSHAVGFLHDVAAHCETLVAGLGRTAQASPSGIVDIKPHLMRHIFEISGTILFGTDATDDFPLFHKHFSVITAHLIKELSLPKQLPLWGTKAIRQRIAALRAMAMEIIEREEALLHDDTRPMTVLRTLLIARSEDPDLYSREQIADEIMNVVFAGVDTVAHTLVWSLLLLARHPEKQETLRHEIDALFGRRPIEFDRYKNLRYCPNVINEALRLYPVVPILTRSACQVVTDPLGDLEQRSTVLLPLAALHRDAAIWPQSDAFQPERFDNLTDLQKKSHLPFGHGPRGCMGFELAMLEMKVTLAELVRNFRFEICEHTSFEYKFLLSVGPKEHACIRVMALKPQSER